MTAEGNKSAPDPQPLRFRLAWRKQPQRLFVELPEPDGRAFGPWETERHPGGYKLLRSGQAIGVWRDDEPAPRWQPAAAADAPDQVTTVAITFITAYVAGLRANLDTVQAAREAVAAVDELCEAARHENRQPRPGRP